MDPEAQMRFVLDALARMAARSEAQDVRQEDQAARLRDHDARLQEHETWQRESETRAAQIEANLQAATNLIGRLAAAELLLNQRMKETEDRLNALIKVVDDLIRRNGHKP